MSDAVHTLSRPGVSASLISVALDMCGVRGQTSGILPLDRSYRICGRALTTRLVSVGATSWEHDEYDSHLRAGDVLVMDAASLREPSSVWGDLRSMVAQATGVAGTVIDGYVSDVMQNVELGYPVFARGPSLITSKDRAFIESTGKPIMFGGVRVEPGDIVFGDATGVVFVPRSREEDVCEVVLGIDGAEAKMRDDLRAGVSLPEARRRHRYMGRPGLKL